MQALVVTLALVTAAVDGEKPRLLVLPIEAKGDVKADVAEQATVLLVGYVRRMNHADVVAYREVEVTMDMERRRQLAGCDRASCAAEIAGALDAQELLMGTLGKMGGTYVLNISRVRSKDAKVLAGSVMQLPDCSENLISAALPFAARELYKDLPASVFPSTSNLQAVLAGEEQTYLRVLGFGGMALGAVGLLTGVVGSLLGVAAIGIAGYSLVVPRPQTAGIGGGLLNTAGWMAMGAIAALGLGVVVTALGGAGAATWWHHRRKE